MSDDKEVAAPFTEDSTKQELVSHLMDVHNIAGLSGQQLFHNAKKVRLTKAQLVEAHTRMHVTLDKPADEVTLGTDGKIYDGTNRYGVIQPTVPHIHEEITVRPEVDQVLRSIREGSDPLEGHRLSAGERSALTRLIDNDFSALKTDLQQLAAATLHTELEQLGLDWADRRAKVAGWQEQVVAIQRDVQDRLQALKDAALEDGIEVVYPRTAAETIRADMTTKGYTEAVKESKERNRKLLEAALLKLERERLRAQRRVLLSGVTPQAAAILEMIPSAEKMLGEAMARDANTRELESVKTDV